VFDEKRMILELFILENFYYDKQNSGLLPKFVEYLYDSGLKLLKSGGDCSYYSREYLKSFKSMMQKTLQNIKKKEKQKIGNNNQIFRNDIYTSSPYPPVSRFKEYFTTIRILGRGGFGYVVEAKNNLDGVHYALKKIKFRADTLDIEKVLREVKSLALLEHKNVCRYYNCWIEAYEEESSREKGRTFRIKENKQDISISDTDLSNQLFNKPTIMNFSNNLTFESDNENLLSERDSNIDETNNLAIVRYQYENNLMEESYVLYIQMQLYSISLKEFLDKENRVVDYETNIQIFQNIIEGLDHIHSKRIIHRDIKPANIFIDINGNAKIGDFGLSTFDSCNEKIDKDSDNNSDHNRSHTSGIGTRSYASPEQLDGKNYTIKSDIYSCGLILFEIFNPCNTMSEKAVSFKDLKKGQISPKLLKNYPNESSMVLWLTSVNPIDRPNTKEILQSSLFSRSQDEIISLRRQLQICQNQIKEQEKEIKELYKQIDKFNSGLKNQE